jgi:hypothetical protein
MEKIETLIPPFEHMSDCLSTSNLPTSLPIFMELIISVF